MFFEFNSLVFNFELNSFNTCDYLFRAELIQLLYCVLFYAFTVLFGNEIISNNHMAVDLDFHFRF